MSSFKTGLFGYEAHAVVGQSTGDAAPLMFLMVKTNIL